MELPDNTMPVEKARFLRNHWEGNAYCRAHQSVMSWVETIHAQIGKVKLLVMPCITPCVNMKCHNFVLKAIPSVVKIERMQPMPIIGLYRLHDPS